MFSGQKEKVKKNIIMLAVLALMIVSVGGCGSAGSGDGTGETASSNDGSSSGVSSGVMGRYVEEVTDLSNKIFGYKNAMYRLANGNIVISDTNSDFLKTGDDGAVWMTDSRRWRTKMLEEGTYIMSLAIGADNTVALIRQVDEETESEEEMSEDGEAESEEEETLADFTLNPQLFIIKPDNTEIPVTIETTEEDSYLYHVYIADNGRIFVSVMGSSHLYEVKEDGSSELFLTLEDGRPEIMQFYGNLMLADGYGYKTPILYDMEKKEYIEDEVLEEFVRENYSDRYYQDDTYDLYYFFTGEDILYLAGNMGVYRHVIGGSAMEQIIDGRLCTLGNPSYRLQGMLPLENNEFLALFEGGRVIHYVYDPDIPTVPSEKIKVYSLTDNENIRQAIGLYQAQNPDVYVEFELGLNGSDSITTEDALKNLNVKIMSGEGPDILILDDMPVDSYIEKGLLEDLTPFVSTLNGEEEPFGNIVEALKTEDKLYSIPCEVCLPVIMAKDKYLSQINNIAGIADAVEELRKDNPGKDLLGFCSEKGIMRVFAMSCEPSWTTQSGDIDREAIAEFLKQTKRIYDAQMDGLPDSALDEYESINDYYAQYVPGAASYDDTDDIRKGTNYMSYLAGTSQMVCGVFDSTYPYIAMTSIQLVEDFEDSGWMGMKGQGGNIFWAETLMGICTASEHKERAEDFIRVCLGKENQSGLYNGLPVNRAAFEEILIPKENEVDQYTGVYGSYIISNDDGLYVHLTLYWPEDEQMEDLVKYMEATDTVYIKDSMLENAVYEEGIAYIQGTQSLEEAVNAIEKKVSLYMAE